MNDTTNAAKIADLTTDAKLVYKGGTKTLCDLADKLDDLAFPR